MLKKYDFIILGGGNAGMSAAKTAFEAGKTVAIVEHQEFGGTCPNRGCTPKKVLVAAAKSLDAINKSSRHCISTNAPTLDWQALIERKNHMISFIPEAMEQVANNRGDVYRGEAEFHNPNTIRVNEHLIEAQHIIIATGSKPRPLPFPGAETLITSDDLLNLETPPESIVFIGGGVIALEFSHVLARTGTKVTVLEAMPHLLPRMDQDAVEQLIKASEELGIRFITDVSIKSVAQDGDKFNLTYVKDDEEVQISAETVVNGAGRVPNISELNLEAGQVATENGSIVTTNHFISASNPHVYLAGDVVATTPQLSPLATKEGQEVVSCILGPKPTARKQTCIPQVIYSIPTLASVGLSEAQARDKYRTLKSHTTDMSSWFSAKTAGESSAWSKILIDEATDRIVGAHIIGHQGEELIHLFTLAMNHGITASDLKQTVFAFPTYSSDLKNLW